MPDFRHLLLAFALFFAQLAAGAHAVGHGLGDEDALPTHACEQCLAGHNLGAALPGVALLLPAPVPAPLPEALPATGRHRLPAPGPRQGAPPNLLL